MVTPLSTAPDVVQRGPLGPDILAVAIRLKSVGEVLGVAVIEQVRESDLDAMVGHAPSHLPVGGWGLGICKRGECSTGARLTDPWPPIPGPPTLGDSPTLPHETQHVGNGPPS